MAPPSPPPSHPVPAYGDLDLMNVTALPPPMAPRAEAPVLPPRTKYVPGTSNHHVPGTSNCNLYIPARKEKRKKLKQHEPWEAPSCARAGLEHYNSMNQGDEHELVKAVGVDSFIWGGGWLHANFLARPKGASNCVDPVPKYFFAELELNASGLHCASCVKMDSVESKNLGGCEHCEGKIMHPAAGGYLGAQAMLPVA